MPLPWTIGGKRVFLYMKKRLTSYKQMPSSEAQLRKKSSCGQTLFDLDRDFDTIAAALAERLFIHP